MKIKIQVNRLWLIVLYLILGCVFVIGKSDVPSQYDMNYITLFAAYLIVGGLYFVTSATNEINLFDPFTIVSLLYMMIMIIYPLYDYNRMNLFKSGVDTSSGCIDGTIIFVLSYISFYFSYITKKVKRRELQGKLFFPIERLSDKEMSWIALFCWSVAFAGCTIGQISRGFPLGFLFSLGQKANEDILINSSSGGLLFLLMLSPTLIVAELMIWVYGKKRMIKCITLVLTIAYLFMRGSRILVFVIIAAPFVYWYLKRGKTPSMRVVIPSAMLALLLFAAMQIARVNITQGINYWDELSENLFSLDAYLAPFESDFSTYKVYYGIVRAIPKHMDYLLGRGIFGYTLALIIPRALWPNKPNAPEREVVYAAMGQLAVDNGNAYPNIGIFYSEFGVIGCIILMWIFGRLLSKSRKLYRMDSRAALILYSCLWPFCFQLTTRSFSNAVYSIMFGMLPMVVAWLFSMIKKARRKVYRL